MRYDFSKLGVFSRFCQNCCDLRCLFLIHCASGGSPAVATVRPKPCRCCLRQAKVGGRRDGAPRTSPPSGRSPADVAAVEPEPRGRRNCRDRAPWSPPSGHPGDPRCSGHRRAKKMRTRSARFFSLYKIGTCTSIMFRKKS